MVLLFFETVHIMAAINYDVSSTDRQTEFSPSFGYFRQDFFFVFQVYLSTFVVYITRTLVILLLGLLISFCFFFFVLVL